MSSDLLGIGASGVAAYRTALGAIGDNVANAETPGYARREVRLTESAIVKGRSEIYKEQLYFGGVEAATVGRAWDEFRAADSRLSSSAFGRADTRAQWLTVVETALDDGPTGVGTMIGGFFTSAALLAAAPDDVLARSQMLAALDAAAGAIRNTADALRRVTEGIGNAAGLEVEALNADLKALGDVNLALQQSAPGKVSRASLEDERDRIIDSISERIDVSASIGEHGVATLTLARATGVTLIEPGIRAVARLDVAADGRLSLATNGTVVPLPVSGGSLAGLTDIAASTADKRASLETIAVNFMTMVNDWSAQGLTPAGVAGAPLLAMPFGAASLAITTTDPAAIAAATADGRENGNLLALSALRGTEGAEARWQALVAFNAQSLAAARSEASAASTRRDNSFLARDEITGIDLDREAAELIRYQQAYNASAKIIQVAREAMQTIIDIF